MPTYKGTEIIGGYYSKDYTQYVDEKLKNMPYAQAGIKYHYNSVWLISYTTHVATILFNDDGKPITVECFGLYSNTTRRHISSFARQYDLDYGIFRASAIANKEISVSEYYGK